jgi:hypothetical protein
MGVTSEIIVAQCLYIVRAKRIFSLAFLIPPKISPDKENFRLVENRLKIVWESDLFLQFEFSSQRNHKTMV